MSITFAKLPVVAGEPYPSLKDAQIAAISALFISDQPSENPLTIKDVSTVIVENAEKVVDVLTTTEKSRPTARRVNGGRKPRKAKAGQQEQSPTAEAQ